MVCVIAPDTYYFIYFSHFADFEQVIIKISHFADFEQVKKLIAKLPWEKPDAYAFLFRVFFIFLNA